MKVREQKRNAPIATLIKNYENKKSGKVSASRDEIKRRFGGLDWKDQKRILMAFLDSGMSDRDWAYTRLLDYWDDSFAPKVKELWETNQEYKCAWVVISFLPLEYVVQHMDEFTGDRDYFFICLRLAKNKDYAIDKAKLSKTDYLALLYHTDRCITYDEAIDTLFSIVHDSCLEDSFMKKLEQTGEGIYPDVITPANYREVRLALYYVLKLQQFEAASVFKNWNEKLEETIYNSLEFKAIDRNKFSSDFEYERRRVEVANIYAYKALDGKYKQPSDPSVEQMIQTYEQGVEWNRMQNDQSAEVLFYSSESDDLLLESEDKGSFPF